MNFKLQLFLPALLALLAAPLAPAQDDTEAGADTGEQSGTDAPSPAATDVAGAAAVEPEISASGTSEPAGADAGTEEAAADDTADPATESEAADEDEGITVLDQVVPVAEDPEPAAAPATDGAEAGPGGSTADPLADPAVGPSLDTGPPAEPFEDPALSDEQRLALAFGRFQEFREAGMLDEAENAAKRAVEISITAAGPGSNDTAKALTNLATVQYDTKNYDAAKQNFQSAIDIYKENEDQLSARLVNPLRGLGAAQLESGRPDEALETYRQAVHITHVNEGPHNIDQLPILEAVAETHLRMGALEDARNAQDMIYSLNLRHLEGDTMNLVPPLMRRAAWQRRTGYVLDERATYRRVIRIIEEQKGPEDIALIEPLTQLAESYFYVDISGTDTFQQATIASGEIYFKRAIRIAEEHPDADWQIQASTMLSLADYYNFRSDQGRARRAYRDVWDFLSTDDERLQMRHETLEQVHPLNEDPIPQYIGEATLADRQQADKGIREGTVIASYDVSSRGRTSRTTIVELTPPEFKDMEDQVVRELRDRIYRPRFIDGEPVDTTELVLTHRFFYLQGELDRRIGAENDAAGEG